MVTWGPENLGISGHVGDFSDSLMGQSLVSVTSGVSWQGTVKTMNTETPAISELLKNARKAQGLTVKAVAQDICVQSSYLKAIENGEYEKLPAHTFAVGFVRSYANALGEDADRVVASFKDECGITKPTAPTVPKSQLGKTRKKIPSWLSPIAGLVGASMCWVALGGSFGGTPMVADSDSEIAAEKAQLAALQTDLVETAIPEASGAGPTAFEISDIAAAHVEENTVEENTVNQSLFIPAAHADTDVLAALPASDVLLAASEDSWVRIARTDGTELWSGILRAGQSYRPSEAGVMLLTTSNAGGLTLTQGAGGAAQLGARGEIVSDYSLSKENQLSEAGPPGVGSR